MKKWNFLWAGAVIILIAAIAIKPLPVFAGYNSISPATERIPIPETTANPQPPYGWEITTKSGEAEISLAKHLKSIGAKEYGAFWCPHCFEQKQLFGKQAFKEINYIECDPQGSNPQPQACTDAEIKAFPTWKIEGKTYQGVQLLEKLAEISGYQGAVNFKYTMPN
jgi:hypothetical protein